ncbi:MAG TPA: VOC family protein [Ktedonobacteraceae bacterium]|nr:VOC family protein [Ktedonobacteraceae bacterium]
MNLNAHGLSHIGLRVTDLARAKHFYVDTLGCQLVREIDGAVLINVYGMLFALSGDDVYTSKKDRFDPFRVGLDHIALAIEDPGILEDLKRELDAAGVRNNGVEIDPETQDKYISFYDPDGIAWELYSISAHPYG